MTLMITEAFIGSNFKVQKGISENQISQLIEFSNSDGLVRKFTSDGTRFQDLQAFEEWRLKNREIYVLNGTDGQLCGIIWFGHKAHSLVKDAGFTFAVRLYPPARGKGLAADFIKWVMSDFMQTRKFQESDRNGIWLETDAENVVAIKTYKKVGFQKVGKDTVSDKIIMKIEVSP